MSIPSIETLRLKKQGIQEKRKSFAENMHTIEKELMLAFSDMEIFASGSDITLEQNGEDDWVYGHLCFGEDGLTVAYRSTEEDYYDDINRVPNEFRGYKPRHFSLCKTKWLEKLCSSKAIQSLFNNLDKQLDEFNSAAEDSMETLNRILEHQTTELNDDALAALSTVGNEILSKHWSKARALIVMDPAESITRSSSYLESVCKKILTDLKVPLPATETISNLVAECINHLKLSDDQKAHANVLQLFGNLRGIFQSVGSIRSNFGTAHGSSPGDYQMGEHYARLINNVAATASTFLLYRHRINIARSKNKD